jgi:hypothetical protein
VAGGEQSVVEMVDAWLSAASGQPLPVVFGEILKVN